ncbi:putative integrase core domain protein [Rhizophagus irregularis DAOM 181602=DAOM 197198]|nr:putative integrase core domain protein [Rhizophagus irregularis DAOM 181602=DAOM 197198]
MDSTQIRSFKSKARHYCSINGILYKKNNQNPQKPLRVLQPSEVEPILYNFHSDLLAGHFGFNETYRTISERYYWPQMGDDIKQYVQTCEICQKWKLPIKSEPLHPIKVGRPFDRIGMDIVGLLPITRTGNQYIIVATEYLTKWPEARALPDAKAASVVPFFYDDIICRHGCPKELLTDQGTHFVNELLDSLCNRLFNWTLCELLAKYSDQYQQDWDVYLPSALFAYRTMRQNMTRYEPFYLMYGREATIPIELQISSQPDSSEQVEDLTATYFKRLYQIIEPLEEDRRKAQQNIHRSQEKQVEQYGKKVHPHRQPNDVLTIDSDRILFSNNFGIQEIHLYDFIGNCATVLEKCVEDLRKEGVTTIPVPDYVGQDDE